MAPTGALVSRSPKSEYHTYLESSKIGGIIVAAILAVLVVAFICIFLYEYRKESRLTAQIGPPHIGKVSKSAMIKTLTLGLAGICSAKRSVESRVPATNKTAGAAAHIGKRRDLRQPPPISKY